MKYKKSINIGYSYSSNELKIGHLRRHLELTKMLNEILNLQGCKLSQKWFDRLDKITVIHYKWMAGVPTHDHYTQCSIK